MLTVDDAHKTFGSTQALKGAGLSLRRDEWLALLGPNGAGKTTLVRAIGGRVRLDRGTITLLAQRLGGDGDAARRRLGIVPQDLAVYPALTATENLRAFGSLHGLTGGDLARRVAWGLAWTGLEDRAREPVKRFSGGMKRRLNLACGVLHEPDVLLLDEPTVGVDPQSRERIWGMLDELREAGASLLLTTHQLDEAQRVADRIVIIDHGAVLATGTFRELLAQTIGTQRRICFILDGTPPPPLVDRGLTIDDDHTVSCQVDDVAAELPGLLAAIETAGATIQDIHIDLPSLQAVFIHLTGRALRE